MRSPDSGLDGPAIAAARAYSAPGTAATRRAIGFGKPDAARAQAVQRLASMMPSQGVSPNSIIVPRTQLAVGV